MNTDVKEKIDNISEWLSLDNYSKEEYEEKMVELQRLFSNPLAYGFKNILLCLC